MQPHVRRGVPIFYGLVLFFAIIEMCDTAYLIAQYQGYGYPTGSIRDRLRFLLFVSIWTIVFSAGYLAAWFAASASIISSIASHGSFLILTCVPFWSLAPTVNAES